MEKKGVLTNILLVANIAVAVIGLFAGTRGGSDLMRNVLMGSNSNIIYRFGLIPSSVRNGQYYRLLTSMFIHSGLMHLLGNMYALHLYGRIVEGALGMFKMGLIYLISGICGGILVMLISGRNTVTVGASGAIFGLMGAAFALAMIMHRMSAIRSIGYVIIMNLAITFAVPNISIGGHIGGLVSGAAIGLVFGLLSKR
ncbi:MAG TPA: hypothetical protein DCO86_02165 [Spirochaetaceae bacterium]|nr:hypothetical protein [Spirochaetaceae bacterium]